MGEEAAVDAKERRQINWQLSPGRLTGSGESLRFLVGPVAISCCHHPVLLGQLSSYRLMFPGLSRVSLSLLMLAGCLWACLHAEYRACGLTVQ